MGVTIERLDSVLAGKGVAYGWKIGRYSSIIIISIQVPRSKVQAHHKYSKKVPEEDIDPECSTGGD